MNSQNERLSAIRIGLQDSKQFPSLKGALIELDPGNEYNILVSPDKRKMKGLAFLNWYDLYGRSFFFCPHIFEIQ